MKPMNYTELYYTITEYMVDINVYVQWISWMKLISKYNTIDGMELPLDFGNESSWAILAVAK